MARPSVTATAMPPEEMVRMLVPPTCHLLTNYLLHAAGGDLLPTTYYLLPATCYLLPTTCYLLPTAYC